MASPGRWSLSLAVVVCLAFVAQAARPGSSSVADESSLGDDRPLLQQWLVDEVNNNKDAGWKAALSPRFRDHKVKDFKRLCGTILTPVNEVEPTVPVRSLREDIQLPESFDVRDAWAHCSSVHAVLDQGHCGSCWAFGAVEALTDRFCTVANISVTLSENDLLACCGNDCGYGCGGGYPVKAWGYFHKTGVVTSQCNPYFDNTGCAHPGCSPVYDTPSCVMECVNDEVWSASKHFGVNVYTLSSNTRDIMADIYQYGPVQVSFVVYEDFAHYESGVYKHLYGGYSAGHAVKLMGWGTTEDGVDYWILANSWNRNWGENGFFRMIRGVDDCGIESNAVAGLPYSDNLKHAPY